MTKQIIWSVLTFLLLLAISITLILVFKYSIHTKVTFEVKPMAETVYCAVELKGDFRQAKAGQDRVYETLKAYDIYPTLGFGRYYDNPKEVPKEECRFEAGCIIEEPEKLTAEVRQGLADEGIIIRTLEEGCLLQSEFPFPNGSALSLMIALMKGYPALEKAVDSGSYETGEVIEIYDMAVKTEETITIGMRVSCP